MRACKRVPVTYLTRTRDVARVLGVGAGESEGDEARGRERKGDEGKRMSEGGKDERGGRGTGRGREEDGERTGRGGEGKRTGERMERMGTRERGRERMRWRGWGAGRGERMRGGRGEEGKASWALRPPRTPCSRPFVVVRVHLEVYNPECTT